MNYTGPKYFLLYRNFLHRNSINKTQFPRQKGNVTFSPLTWPIAVMFAIVALMFSAALPPRATAESESAVLPTRVSFGNVALGITNSQWMTFKNEGRSPITIHSVTATGSGFHFSGIKTPLIVEPGKQTGFSLEFSPMRTGEHYGEIVIKSTASNPTISIPLSGDGVADTRVLSLSHSSLTFGKDAVGTSQTLTVTAKNNGNSELTISSISESDSQLGTSGAISGARLAPGQSASLNVIYSPKKAGNFSGDVKINSNATNSPSTISVTGSAFTATSNPTVKLKWEESASPNIAGYFVYRSKTSNSGFVKLNSTHITGLSYTDDGVAAESTYYYEVSAVNAAGVESSRCAEVKAIVP